MKTLHRLLLASTFARRARTWRQIVAASTILMLAACAQTPPPRPVASNPPPVAPGANATWYHVGFDSNSTKIDANGQKVVNDVTAYLQGNPGAIATIIGRTDTVGSKDYNMHLSHQRADVVRDALVYKGNVAADRVETRWTGESRLAVATAADVSATANRVVDIAIH